MKKLTFLLATFLMVSYAKAQVVSERMKRSM